VPIPINAPDHQSQEELIESILADTGDGEVPRRDAIKLQAQQSEMKEYSQKQREAILKTE